MSQVTFSWRGFAWWWALTIAGAGVVSGLAVVAAAAIVPLLLWRRAR